MNLELIRKYIGKKVLVELDPDYHMSLAGQDPYIEVVLMSITNVDMELCLVDITEANLKYRSKFAKVHKINNYWIVSFSEVIPFNSKVMLTTKQLDLLDYYEILRLKRIISFKEKSEFNENYIKKIDASIEKRDKAERRLSYNPNRFLNLYLEGYISYKRKSGMLYDEPYTMVKVYDLFDHELAKVIHVSPEGKAIIETASTSILHETNIKNIKHIEQPVFDWEIIHHGYRLDV
jgi:hypothetical protein